MRTYFVDPWIFIAHLDRFVTVVAPDIRRALDFYEARPDKAYDHHSSQEGFTLVNA